MNKKQAFFTNTPAGRSALSALKGRQVGVGAALEKATKTFKK